MCVYIYIYAHIHTQKKTKKMCLNVASEFNKTIYWTETHFKSVLVFFLLRPEMFHISDTHF